MGSLSLDPRRYGGGYTLIELLVVAAIVGALVSVASLAWRSDPARTLEAEAQRLAGKLELAQARARIGGARLAFSASADDYLFWQRDASTWHEIEADSGLERCTLAQGIHISGLTVAGVGVPLGRRVAIAADDEVALSIQLTGPGASAVVASGPYVGQMAVRLARN